jgi:phosphopentomutase
MPGSGRLSRSARSATSSPIAGTGEEIKGSGNEAMCDSGAGGVREGSPTAGFCFANFVDFDTLYGHRRDIPEGYGARAEAFDA